MSAKNTRFVVAIDFGTARSGYAYAVTHNPDVTTYLLVWPEQTWKTEKTPTILLAGPQNNIVNHGYPALKQLANLAGPDANGYTLIDMFKMTLHESDEPGAAKPQTKRGGRSFDSFSLIVEYLRWMRKIAIDQISKSLTAAWDEKEVRWCLSVPAIWSPEAKGVMRAAAVAAGLIDSRQADAQRLNLVLEPEAAAIYCQTQNKDSIQFQIKSGQTFMVVDAGGGTLDITTHRVTDDGELDALTEAMGGRFGSMYVDLEFRRWLAGVLGTASAEELNVSFPKSRLELLEKWEVIKCRFDGSPTWEDTIMLPDGFYSHLL